MRLPPRLCLPVLLALIAAIALAALVVAALPAQAATQDADGARVIVKFKALGPLMRSARERGDRGPQQGRRWPAATA